MSDTNAAISVTLKAGDYGAPWIVIYGDDPAQVAARLDGVAQAGLLAKAAETAAEFAGVYNAAAGLGAKATAVEGTQQPANPGAWGSSSQQQAPAQGQAGPGPAPQCQHGSRVYKTGRSAKGPWAAWFCPRPKGAPDACAPEWV